MANGFKRGIQESPSTFLGEIVGKNQANTKQSASKQIIDHLLSTLSQIDSSDSSIKGEYKVWTYRRYFCTKVTLPLLSELV